MKFSVENYSYDTGLIERKLYQFGKNGPALEFVDDYNSE